MHAHSSIIVSPLHFLFIRVLFTLCPSTSIGTGSSRWLLNWFLRVLLLLLNCWRLLNGKSFDIWLRWALSVVLDVMSNWNCSLLHFNQRWRLSNLRLLMWLDCLALVPLYRDVLHSVIQRDINAFIVLNYAQDITVAIEIIDTTTARVTYYLFRNWNEACGSLPLNRLPKLLCSTLWLTLRL